MNPTGRRIRGFFLNGKRDRKQKKISFSRVLFHGVGNFRSASGRRGQIELFARRFLNTFNSENTIVINTGKGIFAWEFSGMGLSAEGGSHGRIYCGNLSWILSFETTIMRNG